MVMMQELARVVACEGDGWVVVDVELKSACGQCASSESCGTSAVAKAFSDKSQRFAIASDEQFEAGEMLTLGLPESVLLRAAALVYLLPLAGFFLGALMGDMLSGLLELSADLVAIFLGLFGAVAGWSLGRRWARALENESQPKILARLGREVRLHKSNP
jgi:sigma-E factor negative regulatory protein RseC